MTEHTHGASGYAHFGCRCDKCRDAQRARMAKYQAKKRRLAQAQDTREAWVIVMLTTDRCAEAPDAPCVLEVRGTFDSNQAAWEWAKKYPSYYPDAFTPHFMRIQPFNEWPPEQ